MKSTFLTHPYCKIYTVEAICLFFPNYTWKIMIFVNMCSLRQFHENLILCHLSISCLIKVRILMHTCDTYNSDYLPHTIFCLYFIYFQLNKDFASQFVFVFVLLCFVFCFVLFFFFCFVLFCFFYHKFTRRYSKIGFSRKYFKRAKTCRLFVLFCFSQNNTLKYFFNSKWKQVQVFKIAKFEFKVWLMGKNAPSCDPLTHVLTDLLQVISHTCFRNTKPLATYAHPPN